MKLPNAEQALVDLVKLRDYCLNAEHPEGKHKARVFAAVPGFTAADAAKLREMILAAVTVNEAVQWKTDEHGARYTMDFTAEGLQSAVMIRTGWIIDAGESVPRLVSCYVKRK